MTLWTELGVIRYPLAIVAMFLLVQTVRAILDLRERRESVPYVAEMRIHTILLWGVLGAAVGVLGTLVGISVLAGAMERVREAPPRVVWGGVKVALSSSVVGLTMLGYAALVWLGLHAIRARRFDSRT